MEEKLQEEGGECLNACSPLVQTDKCLSYTCSQEVTSNIAEQFLQNSLPSVEFAILTGGVVLLL